MTQAAFTLLYARLGNREKAAHWFQDSYVPQFESAIPGNCGNKGWNESILRHRRRRHFAIGDHGLWRRGNHTQGTYANKVRVAKGMEGFEDNRSGRGEADV